MTKYEKIKMSALVAEQTVRLHDIKAMIHCSYPAEIATPLTFVATKAALRAFEKERFDLLSRLRGHPSSEGELSEGEFILPEK